jgi:omega-6 fatty acid desaturase (delta-12 desaturase)
MSNQEMPAGGLTGDQTAPVGTSEWKEIVRKYQTPSLGRSLWQIANTLGPYFLIWVGIYFALSVSYALVVPLALLAGAFLVRTFIIFHDCTHGSFFKSRKANDFLGFFTGVLAFTPYHHWKWSHSLHHSSSGDLDRRGMGDVWTLTVQEYLDASPGKRFAYRLVRNPFILFVLAPLFLFVVWHRIPDPDAKGRVRYWVYVTNMALALQAFALALVFGFWNYLLIQSLVLLVASTAGVWLFYVQHQFEDVSWERGEDWDFAQAALQGSSFYQLPKILQWFSGNIGYHHIHHLSPRIPNYRLERAHDSEPLFQAVKPLTLRGSLKSFTFRLWDESHKKLVGYKALRSVPAKS